MAESENLFELKRKLFHIIIGSLLTALIFFGILKWWMLLLLVVLGLILSKIYTIKNIPIIDWFLKTFERPAHLRKIPARGLLTILLSALILTLLTTKNIAAASLMIWTFGDSMTAIVGAYPGRTKNNLKNHMKHPFNDRRLLIGTLVGIVAATIASTPFVGIWPALIASFISLAIESLELKVAGYDIEDNLLVPLLSAVVLVVLSMYI